LRLIPKELKLFNLTKIGETNVSTGSPDTKLFSIIIDNMDNQLTTDKLNELIDPNVVKIGMGKLMKNKLISIDKKTKLVTLTDDALNNRDK